MKWIISLLLVGVLLWHDTVAQENPHATLSQAEIAYVAGDYETAIALYQSVIEQGVGDSTVYFNLGNAYYGSGQLGWALVNYRRAQQISPRDTAINANIALIRSERLDFQRGESSWVDRLAVSTQDMMTLPELGWTMLGLWTVWFMFIAAWVLRPELRSRLRWLLIITGWILLVGLLLFSSRLYVAHYRSRAVIVDLSTQAMSGPGDAYLPMFEFFDAAEIRILDVRGQWVRFVLPDGRQGWIQSSALEEI